MRTQLRLVFVLVVGAVGVATSVTPEEMQEVKVPADATQLADALRAAPPSVTKDATIYGWTSGGELKPLRSGTGSYTCVASGKNSLRLGKPLLPYPDSFCAEANAWRYLVAVMAETDPLNPEKPLPTTPGFVWMLEGMNIHRGGIKYGKSDTASVDLIGGDGGEEHVQMTPHLMILPLPIDHRLAGLSDKYDPDEPGEQWVMAAGTPLAHLHVHFSPAVKEALMNVGR